MNTKTFLSKFPTFSKKWGIYQKGIAPLPLGWTVMSDYCLDNPLKQDCITFTISPMLGQLQQVAHFLSKKLPRDIKQVRHFSDEELSFLSNKVFFSLVFVIKDKKHLVNMDFLKEDIQKLQSNSFIPEVFRQRLKNFEQSLKSKNLPKKVLQNLSLVSFIFGKIVEFLTIKHYTEEIHWFPDRDNIMTVGNGIIKELSNVQCTNSIAGRRKYPKISIGIENPNTNEFVFDPFTRYPDIITGVFSSIDFEAQRVDKVKHLQVLEDVIINNPRIVLFSMDPDKISCVNLRRASCLERKTGSALIGG